MPIPVPPWIVFVVAVGLLVLIFTYKITRAIMFSHGSSRSIRRRGNLSAWAYAKGLTFDALPDDGLADRFSNFKCLRRGMSRYAYNRMAGKWGDLPIMAFDYHYSIGTSENRIDYDFSAVIITSRVPLKPLYICREGFLDKLTESIGFDDIDFESAQFSRKFRVKSPDKRWAYDVIHARTMEHLLAGPDVSIQLDFMHIIAWSADWFSPADFDAAIELISGILDRLPEYVVQRQRGD
ncbi:MAG: hypothetical protein KAV00_02735 [Phycisphaerae bacterium]|nr:hypothetical protein [Phycisphaerae bacterium]